MKSYDEKMMNLAVKEAERGIILGDGGPFGAVITLHGEVVSVAHNMVLKTNDPTNHAEIVAIRNASRKLEKFDLSECVIYTSCKPCPMCLAAIYWAKIKIVYYAAGSEHAEEIGFNDKIIYDFIKSDNDQDANIYLEQHLIEKYLVPIKKWANLPERREY